MVVVLEHPPLANDARTKEIANAQEHVFGPIKRPTIAFLQ